MDFLITESSEHRKHFFRIEPGKEIVSLFDGEGNFLKSATFDEMASLLLESKMGTRRKHLRTTMAVKIKYQSENGSWKESITGTLGTGGLFIETPSPFDKGSDIALELFLPDSPPQTVKTKGKVVWTRNQFEKVLHFPGMGIEFSKISGNERDAIERLIKTINRSRGME
ncbi:MAG: PilZ domain-containing protein [Nitrospirae bacterium]|nr:PilZ domain-containing protein [Nitrospirota bacterium]MBI3594728.1 PilZ domain-containing protein [Nitrospirota bacterium]